MDTEGVVSVYSGILVIKRSKTGSFVEMWVEAYTEWSKSEREKQIVYINTHVESENLVDDLVCKAEIVTQT